MAKLNAIIKGYKGDLVRVARDASLELGNRVQLGTPVDTGHARRSWDGSGGFGPGQSYKFINNVPYIERLEDGHSGQAPQGMLKTNIRNWQSIVDSKI